MITLTETMVDIADCHTTLYYLAGTQPPAKATLLLGTKGDYESLHNQLHHNTPQTYSDIRPGHTATIVNKVFPAYRGNKFWRRYTDEDEFPTNDLRAWERILPLEVSLKSRIRFVNDGSFNFKVSPLPSVLIYPFGWSTWLSFRLTSDHTIGELSRFVQYIFSKKALELEVPAAAGSPPTFTLREYLAHVAAGVRADVFGAGDTKDTSSQDLVMVTTVLAKHGGSPSLTAPTQKHVQDQLLRIVKPEGPAPSKTIADYTLQLKAPDKFQFLIRNDFGRFIWLEHLLSAAGQNNAWLGCHHNNTVRSLTTALHLHRLIRAADSNRKNLSAPLLELLEAASVRLAGFGYKNASLRSFLEGADVAASIQKVANISAQTP